jgi:predicted nucleic acid-binding protein
VNFLLDTNVVSEWSKPRLNAGVVRWLAEQDEDRLFLSVITLAEVRRGVERLAVGARRSRLEKWLGDELSERFAGRILRIDEAVAKRWGSLIAASEAQGKRMNVMDGFLAATAVECGLTLVTRNVGDFLASGCEVFSPWEI